MADKYIIEKHEKDSIWRMYADAYGDVTVEGVDLTPYTEPDVEQVNAEKDKIYDEARARGYEEGKARGYQEGLFDAWAAARKIALMDTETSENVTGYFGLFRIMENLTPMQAIEKIRQYEQEKEMFHVGDEFETESGRRFVILKMNDEKIDRYIDQEGKTYCMNVKYATMRKTGRHFPEIAAFFAKMKGES